MIRDACKGFLGLWRATILLVDDTTVLLYKYYVDLAHQQTRTTRYSLLLIGECMQVAPNHQEGSQESEYSSKLEQGRVIGDLRSI